LLERRSCAAIETFRFSFRIGELESDTGTVSREGHGFMTRQMLEDYARLLTTDTHGCSKLFANDAEFLTRIGSQSLHLRGRSEIRSFLTHVPRQMKFRPGEISVVDDAEYQGRLAVSAADLGTTGQIVRYKIERGLFTRFEIESVAHPHAQPSHAAVTSGAVPTGAPLHTGPSTMIGLPRIASDEIAADDVALRPTHDGLPPSGIVLVDDAETAPIIQPAAF
jgi:hypothetical protein